MDKLSFVNTKHYKNLVILRVTISSHDYNFDFQIPKLAYNGHHTSLMYTINSKKIGYFRFKNDILLYLVIVTNASVIYHEVMLRCTIF